MGAITEFMRTVGGILLTIAFIGFVVMLYALANDTGRASTNDWTSITSELNDHKFLNYDNTPTTGSQVVNAMRKFQGEADAGNIALQIKTGANKSGTWYHNSFGGANGQGNITIGGGVKETKNINDSTNIEYVNPTGRFKSQIFRDTNSVVRAIVFEQY